MSVAATSSKRHIALKNKRKHILDAAYIVFSRKGFHRATVDEIIALADTGKGTVYNYFVNKEQLFYTLISEKNAPFHETLEKITRTEAPIIEKIQLLTQVCLKFYVENSELWLVLMHEVRAFGERPCTLFSEEKQLKYRILFESTIKILEDVIKAGIEQGVIRECNAKQSAYGLFSAILALVFQNLVDDDLAVTADSIARTFLFGVATERAARQL